MNHKHFELPNFDRSASPTRELLEQTRLSCLPSLPRRAVYENCTARLETDDEFQASLNLCRNCLRSYASIGAIIEKHTAAKIRRNYQGAK